MSLLEVMALRVKRVSELVEDTLFLNLDLRLAKKLLSLGEEYGEPVEDGVRVNLKLSQEEWGDLVGATRESVNKQLRQWTEDKLVRMERGYIIMLDREQLEKLSNAVGY